MVKKVAKRILVLIIAATILVLDFISKQLVRTYSPDAHLLPFLSLTFVRNQGSAFGLISGHNWLFIIISIIILGAFAYFYRKIPLQTSYIVAVGLVIGGALGNLLDRVVFGYVTDFITVPFWPSFNIADSAITVGVILLLVVSFRKD